MISIAERSLSEGISASKSGTSQIAVSVRQYINDLENPSFNYVPLFGQETALQIREILASAQSAKSRLSQSQLSEPAIMKEKQNIFSRISDWLMITYPVNADENEEEVKKTLNYLDQSSSRLSVLFDVSKPRLLTYKG